MATLSRVFLFYVILMIKNSVKSDSGKPQNIFQTKTFRSNNGIVGVASVAEITSRNGRVSSMGGVKFFPEIDTKLDKNPKSTPWTFSKKSDDGFTVGAVQVYPGAVSVVSSVSSGNPKDHNHGNLNINPFNWPAMNTFLPQPTISTRSNMYSMFPKSVFKNMGPVTPEFDNTWFYPTYNPFLNIWQ